MTRVPQAALHLLVAQRAKPKPGVTKMVPAGTRSLVWTMWVARGLF